MKTAPCPSPALSARIDPPCSSTRLLQIDKPSPSPDRSWRIAESACQNRSKTYGSCAGSMPAPVSATCSRTRGPSFDSRTCTRPPRGVNLTAFDTRFETICCTRAGSASTMPAAPSRDITKSTPLACAMGFEVSTPASTMGARSIGRGLMRSLPLTMRDTSSRSSMSWPCSCALRSMVSSARCCIVASSFPDFARRTQPVIALSGERNSCDTTARNWSLAAVATSAARRASTSATSSSLRRTIVIAQQWFSGMPSLSASRTALTSTGTSLPAAVRRIRCTSSARPCSFSSGKKCVL